MRMTNPRFGHIHHSPAHICSSSQSIPARRLPNICTRTCMRSAKQHAHTHCVMHNSLHFNTTTTVLMFAHAMCAFLLALERREDRRRPNRFISHIYSTWMRIGSITTILYSIIMRSTHYRTSMGHKLAQAGRREILYRFSLGILDFSLVLTVDDDNRCAMPCNIHSCTIYATARQHSSACDQRVLCSQRVEKKTLLTHIFTTHIQYTQASSKIKMCL